MIQVWFGFYVSIWRYWNSLKMVFQFWIVEMYWFVRYDDRGLQRENEKEIKNKSQIADYSDGVERRCRVIVRLGTAGLLIGIEYSRVRNSSWMYLTSHVTTRIGVELATIQRKLPNCVVVGFQLYLARIFHVTLSPRIYKGRQGPPRKTINT